MKTITALKAWMAAATPDEQEVLAEAIGSSRGMLYQYAGGHREVSAARAGQIEAATRAMARASKGRLQPIYRTDLVRPVATASTRSAASGRARSSASSRS
jgi:DNA-binding transcriptional regulator YdaS (Cro superfamily)